MSGFPRYKIYLELSGISKPYRVWFINVLLNYYSVFTHFQANKCTIYYINTKYNISIICRLVHFQLIIMLIV